MPWHTTRRRVALGVGTAVVLMSTLLAQAPPAATTEAVAIYEAWIQATGYLADARNALAGQRRTDTARTVGRGPELGVRANRVAAEFVREAEHAVPAPDAFVENDEARRAAVALRSSLVALRNDLDRHFDTQRRLRLVGVDAALATLAASLVDGGTEHDPAWREWMAATDHVGGALVTGLSTASLGPNVCVEHRARFLDRLREAFPERTGEPAGERHPLDASVTRMEQRLSGIRCG